MQRHHPDLIDQYKADVTHRAVYQEDEKMVAIEGYSKILYNLAGDPGESQAYRDEKRIAALSQVLDAYLEISASRGSGSSRNKVSLKDELIQQRMRDLGYLE